MDTIYKLKKPIRIDGREITELDVDFDMLSVADLKRAEKQFVLKDKKNKRIEVKETEKSYAMIIISMLNDITVEDLEENLSAKDYLLVFYKYLAAFGDDDDDEDEDEGK